MTIKLDDLHCLGRVNGLHEQDSEGSYIAFECVEKGGPGYDPKRLVFVVVETVAEDFAANLNRIIRS